MKDKMHLKGNYNALIFFVAPQIIHIETGITGRGYAP